jgi:broad specificity phosphatase PhoE
MPPSSALRRKREKRSRAQATADALAGLINGDPAKVRVMAHFRELVADGHAEWHTLESGEIELRLQSGEIYLLADTTVTRLA